MGSYGLKRILDTKSRAYNFSFSYNNVFQKVQNRQTDRQTDRHSTYRSINTCNMESQVRSVWKSTQCGKQCHKRRPNRTETVPGATIIFSRLNGKYNRSNPSIWGLRFINILNSCSGLWMYLCHDRPILIDLWRLHWNGAGPTLVWRWPAPLRENFLDLRMSNNEPAVSTCITITCPNNI